MITVEADPEHNILVLKYSGHVGSHAVKHCVTKIEGALGTLQPGFRMVTDLSGLQSMEYGAAPEISQLMDTFNAKGVATVVRVIPDSKKDIGFKMMSYFHYGPNVHIITCQTVTEANTALAT